MLIRIRRTTLLHKKCTPRTTLAWSSLHAFAHHHHQHWNVTQPLITYHCQPRRTTMEQDHGPRGNSSLEFVRRRSRAETSSLGSNSAAARREVCTVLLSSNTTTSRPPPADAAAQELWLSRFPPIWQWIALGSKSQEEKWSFTRPQVDTPTSPTCTPASITSDASSWSWN